MKKITLSLLTLEICLTSLGQPGWDVFNNTTVNNKWDLFPINILVQSGGGTHFIVEPGITKAGWGIPAKTLTTVYICWANSPEGCLGSTFPANNVCWTDYPNPKSGLVTVTGTCNYNFFNDCDNAPLTITVTPGC